MKNERKETSLVFCENRTPVEKSDPSETTERGEVWWNIPPPPQPYRSTTEKRCSPPFFFLHHHCHHQQIHQSISESFIRAAAELKERRPKRKVLRSIYIISQGERVARVDLFDASLPRKARVPNPFLFELPRFQSMMIDVLLSSPRQVKCGWVDFASWPNE